MAGSGGVERLWWTRLRWRMRGGLLWPSFIALTVVDGLLLVALPPYGERGPGNALAGVLLAGFANLILVAALAPVAARAVRRARRDVPRVVASEQAGTALIWLFAAALLVAGLLHRPAVAGAEADRRAQFVAVHDYVSRSAPEFEPGLRAIDVMRIEPDLFRSCVPGSDPKRPLCLIVHTNQRPARVAVDGDRAPNAVYRLHGGFD